MAEDTKIGWCDATFNPWIGCSKVSAGCTHCYAERDFDHRHKRAQWGSNGTRVLTSEDNWKKPLKWNRQQHDRQAWHSANCFSDAPTYRVFCASLCDIFEDWQGEIKNYHGDTMMICPNGHVDGSVWEQTPQSIECSNECGADMLPMTIDDVRRRLFQLIDQTPELTWLLLTKRPENIERMWPTESDGHGGKLAAMLFGKITDQGIEPAKGRLIKRRDNVMLGTSVENQETANERVPHLLKCKPLASKLFLSAEPLLGPIDLALAHRTKGMLPGWPEPCRVDWVIAGCESGPQRRPMQLDWCESMLSACKEKGVAFFMKQMEIDGKVETDVAKFPASLRVQEFPK
jgi:protein gp37